MHDEFSEGHREASSLSGHRCGWSCSRKASPMNFPRPGKIIRPMFGSSLGFVGLDGQKAYVMNFHRAPKKHLAA